jgi:hypothetical protein
MMADAKVFQWAALRADSRDAWMVVTMAETKAGQMVEQTAEKMDDSMAVKRAGVTADTKVSNSVEK